MISKSSGKINAFILWVARGGYSALLLLLISGLSPTTGRLIQNQNISPYDLNRLQPLAVEPFIQIARLSASDKMENDRLGRPMDMSGDTVVVGAGNISIGSMEHAGAVYVFAKPTTGWKTMTQSAFLTASDKAGGNYFGSSVAISEDLIVVGAGGADPGGDTDPGAVYVFVKPSGGWTGSFTESAKLIVPAREDGDRVSSIAISGESIVVGVGQEYSDSNSAHVFTKPAGGWKGNLNNSAKLIASDSTYDDGFGFDIAISGDVVAVSATRADPDGVNGAGVIYIFKKPAGGWEGTLTENAVLTAGDKHDSDQLGVSVSIWGNVVAAGTPYAEIGGINSAGSAYVFVKQGNNWNDMSHTAKLTASDGEKFDHLGESISIDGDTIITGAYTDNIDANMSQGSVYVFGMPAGGWKDMTETQKLTAQGGEGGSFFGSSASISNNTIAVGANGARVDGTFNAGAVFVFEKNGIGLNTFLPYIKR